jgi:hypothetical protein
MDTSTGLTKGVNTEYMYSENRGGEIQFKPSTEMTWTC